MGRSSGRAGEEEGAAPGYDQYTTRRSDLSIEARTRSGTPGGDEGAPVLPGTAIRDSDWFVAGLGGVVYFLNLNRGNA